jgi:hypothetical protein
MTYGFRRISILFLLVGSSILKLNSWDLQTYSNKFLISVNQGSSSLPGHILFFVSQPSLSSFEKTHCFFKNLTVILGRRIAGGQLAFTNNLTLGTQWNIWCKTLPNRYAVLVFFNIANQSLNITCDAVLSP